MKNSIEYAKFAWAKLCNFVKCCAILSCAQLTYLVSFFRAVAGWTCRRLALRSIRRRQQVGGAGWVPWTKADVLGLARYVTADAKLWADLPINRYDLLKIRSLATRRQLVTVIYNRLVDANIKYSENQYNQAHYQQRIRSPIETVGVDAREGTCLDLAILFAGICLGCDLLPIVVLLGGDSVNDSSGHSFVLVSISHDLNNWRKRPECRGIENPVTDASVLQGLLNGQLCKNGADCGSSGTYLAIECTGFASADTIGGTGPESIGRYPDRKAITFEQSIGIGASQLDTKNLQRRPLRAAVDIASAHFLHGITPYHLPPRPRAWWKPYAALMGVIVFISIGLWFVLNWKLNSDQANTLANEVLAAQTPPKEISDRLNSASESVRSVLRTRFEARIADYLVKRENVPEAKPNLDPQSHDAVARAAVALYHLGDPNGILQVLDTKDRPYHPEGRTLTLWYLATAGVHASDIHKWIKEQNSPSVRQALLLALGEYEETVLRAEVGLEETVLKLFETDDDPGVHAAAQWLFTSTSKFARTLSKASIVWTQARSQGVGRLANRPLDRRQWFVHSSSGITFVYLPGPIRYQMGHIDTQERTPQGATEIGSPTRHGVKIERALVVSMTEVTIPQYEAVRTSTHQGPLQDSPPVTLTWTNAADFCNRLAMIDGRPVGYEMSLAPNGVTPLAKQKPGHLVSDGYRLPTEGEWEYFCRAGSFARYSFGDQPIYLERYGAYLSPDLRAPTVAKRRPNDFGLFDCHGGVWEWCDDSATRYPSVLPGEFFSDGGSPRPDIVHRIARGGAFDSRDWLICASYSRGSFAYVSSNQGFRIIRTFSK